MLDTTHRLGDEVIASVDAQGLTKGETYVICDLTAEITPFGTFITYYVADEYKEQGPWLAIGNGHLVLSKVTA